MDMDTKGTTIHLEGGEVHSKESDTGKEGYVDSSRNVEDKLGLDIFNKPYSKIKFMSIWLKLHWCLAVAVNIICIFVWRYATDDPAHSFWWWIIPMFLFATSLTLHHYIEDDRYLDGIINATIIVNIFLFTINVLTMDKEGFFFAWWIYPAIISVMVIYPLYQYIYKSEQHNTISNAVIEASPTATIVPYEMNWFQLVMFEYACISIMLFLTWVNVKLGHPWFIYPMLVLGSPIVYWRMKSSEDRLWVLLVPQVLILNAIVFVAWAFTSSKIPWFLPVLGASFCFIAIMWLIWWRGQKNANKLSEENRSQHRGTNPEEIIIQ